MTDFIKLQNLLKKPLAKYNLDRVVSALEICQVLEEIIISILPEAENKIRVRSLHGHTFKIKSSPGLAQKIDMQQTIIFRKFHEKIGNEDRDYDLRFVAE